MKKLFLLFLASLSGVIAANAQCVFNYTGNVQSWTVPYGVNTINVDIVGASGGMAGPSTAPVSTTTVGKGARVQATIPVTPGQLLRIYVGGAGNQGTSAGCTGGWNGGGNSAGRPFPYTGYSGGGGGGGTDIRAGGAALTDRIVVAGGGGGAAYNGSCPTGDQPGGDGGGLTGAGTVTCTATLIAGGYTTVTTSTGGTQVGGGIGGVLVGPGVYTPGNAGTLGIGGDAVPTADPGISGGGGGGYYGGGAGCWMGGGGGSSYTIVGASAVTHTPGYQTGNGQVTITLPTPTKIFGAAPLCTGQKLTLSSDAAGGIWTSSNTAVATVDADTGIVYGTGPGIVTITYTQRCSSVKLYVNINVRQSPTAIIGPDPVCVGSTVTYSDATPGGIWTISSTAAATFTPATASLSGIYPGMATLTYSDPIVGCFVTKDVHVFGIAGPTKVCNGQQITLVSSSAGGTWTSSNTAIASVGSTGDVTGVSIGTATISYSSPVCPSAYTITVFPIAPNAGADSICISGSGYVTNVVGGGTWISSDPSVASVAAGTGLVNGRSVGTATISYITVGGCLSKSTLEVIKTPPVILGFKEVCPGNTILLTDTATWGEWSSLNTTVATVNPKTGMVTGVTADTVSIIYTVRPGCSSVAKVIVNPIPYPFTGPDTLCPGFVDTMHCPSFGGLWSTTTPLLDTIVDSTGQITAKFQSGFASVTYTLPTGCKRSKNIYVRNVPLPAITYDWPTQTFHAPTGYQHYQWYDSVTGKIPHANSPTLAAIYYEWYYVIVTDENGCQARSPLYYFESSVLGVGNTTANSIKMYPNPVNATLYIESNITVRAVITAIDGKVVIDKTDARQIDVSMLSDAAYMVSLYDDSGQLLSVQKMVKK